MRLHSSCVIDVASAVVSNGATQLCAGQGSEVGDTIHRLIAKAPQRNSAVLEAIFVGPGQPYAIVDAARTPRVLRLVKECGDRARILYEGHIAPEIAEVAPYL